MALNSFDEILPREQPPVSGTGTSKPVGHSRFGVGHVLGGLTGIAAAGLLISRFTPTFLLGAAIIGGVMGADKIREMIYPEVAERHRRNAEAWNKPPTSGTGQGRTVGYSNGKPERIPSGMDNFMEGFAYGTIGFLTIMVKKGKGTAGAAASLSASAMRPI